VLLPARGEEGARSALGAAKPERVEQYLMLTNKRVETERRGFVSPSSSEFFLLVLCCAWVGAPAPVSSSDKKKMPHPLPPEKTHKHPKHKKMPGYGRLKMKNTTLRRTKL
jgi:hypothetical protein